MKTKKSNLSRQRAARIVLAANGLIPGLRISQFEEHLVAATAAASLTERIRLEMAYPDVVRAVQIYQQEPGGIDLLRRESV